MGLEEKDDFNNENYEDLFDIWIIIFNILNYHKLTYIY